MKWLTRAPLLLIALLAALLVGIGLLGLLALSATTDALKTVVDDRAVPLAQLGEIQARMLLNARLVTIGSAATTPEQVARDVDEVRNNIARITEQWLDYSQTFITPEEQQLGQRFTAARLRYVNEAMRPALRAMQAGRFDEARRVATEVLPLRWSEAQVEMAALMALQVRIARAESEAAQQRYERQCWLIGLALAAGLVVALGLRLKLRHAPPAGPP